MVRLIEKILPPIAPPPNPLKVKTGDTVELKTGGPKMTVKGLSGHGHIICQWFEKEKLHQARFLPSSVTLAKN